MVAAAVETPLVELTEVSRRFGYRTILDRVRLVLSPGDALALLGPNGAGKTTLFRIMAGLLRPSQGTLRRGGSVSLVAHDTMLYDQLTARENLAFFARLLGGVAADRVDPLIDRLGLTRWRDQRVSTFSRGLTQRLSIARALLKEPDLLLLDEPLTGLDAHACGVVLNLLRELRAKGCCILIATHQYERVTPVVTGVAFLVSGRLEGPLNVRELTAAQVMHRYAELAASD